jgi:hypothetical protein
MIYTPCRRRAEDIRGWAPRFCRCLVLTGAIAFAPAVGAAQSIAVTAPNSSVNWGIGSSRTIKWTHSLGFGTSVRLEKLILNLDGSIASIETIAASIGNSSSSGSFTWVVSGPATARARIRVSAADNSISDISDVNFTVAAPFITVAAPAAGASWGMGTPQRLQWTTNLSATDSVQIALSTDGGTSFTVPILSAAATAGLVTFTVPVVPTLLARVRVLWTNAPTGVSAQGINPGNFRVEAAYVRLTAPNGGNVWNVATMRMVQFVTNLVAGSQFKVELSLNGGASYPILLFTGNAAPTPVVMHEDWITAAARLRVTWLGSTPTVQDQSDGTFVIARGLLLSNGTLGVSIRRDNGAIAGLALNRVDFFSAGTPVSDYGFQIGTLTASYRRNRTDGRTQQAVTVFEGGAEATVIASYVRDTVHVDIERRYQLVIGHNVLRITTTLINLGPELVFTCFETFDPDHGVMRDTGRNTYNDVYPLAGITVARATERKGFTMIVGSLAPNTTVAAGKPFWLDTGAVLNNFFTAPYDGNGTLADQGLHLGVRILLPQGVSRTFVQHHAFGATRADAEAAFIAAVVQP